MINTKYTYTAKGILLTKKDYGSTYTFKYNERDQLTELVCEGYKAYTNLYSYNEKGLVIRMQTIPGKPDPGGQQSEAKECTYGYTYY